MFSSYVYEKSSANYDNKILLIDYDNLEETTNYSSEFSAHGFEVLTFADDLHFRIDYEAVIKVPDTKLAVLVKSGTYVPYDICRDFRAYQVSLANLFPRLNLAALKVKKALDLDLLYFAYRNNFSDLHKSNLTEQFITSKVYERDNISKYILLAYSKVEKNIQAAKGYSDWFAIAEEKAKIDVLATEYSIPVDTTNFNHKFCEYILCDFGKLSMSIDKRTPVLVSKAMEYMHDHSDKFVVIVMDGMSEFDWGIISNSFGELEFEKASMFAMIPTTTSISRQCLLSNKYPSQLINPWSQSKEKMEFIACAKAIGYSDKQIEYARGYDADFGSFVKCGAIIINDVDDIVHGQQQGRIGMFKDITVLSTQGKLVNAVKRLIKRGFDVYIGADHGNTPCIGLGKLMGTGVEVETKSRRMLVLKDFADKETLLEKYGLIEYPKYYLTKEYDYLICDVGDSFDAKCEDVMTHGGITLDEVVVPFIKIKAVQKNG